MLGRKVAERLAEVPPAEVWSPELRELCAGCDALILNLECCISERGEPTDLIPGKPFFFRAPLAAIESLRAIGARAATAANNHCLDYGPDALEDTLAELAGAGIATAGAGVERNAARRGVVVDAGALRVGVLAVTDHPKEFESHTAYADLRAGMPDWVADELSRLGGEADVVLAFPHWGPNMTTRPARWQRRRARELLDAGADAVAGHSAHVFHGIALLDGGPVLYDLGDGLDDYAVDRELRNDLGLMALWRPGGDPQLELVGLFLDYCRTELAQGADADWIAERLEEACEELGTRVERTGEQRFEVYAAGDRE